MLKSLKLSNMVIYLFFAFLLSVPALAEKVVNQEIYPVTQWGRISYGKNRVDMSGEDWMDIALKDYTARGVGDISWLNGTSWGELKQSQVRFDGWFKVDAAKAGEWTINQKFDDYFAFYIDGVRVLFNNTYSKAMTATASVTEGWHRFTIIGGDTYGAYGSSVDFSDTKVPFTITVGESTYAFNNENFPQGGGESVYTLSADEDWSSEGTVLLSNGAVIDLNGYNLTLSDIDSNYIGTYVTNSAKTASFVFFTGDPDGSTAVAKALIKKGGNIALVNKDESFLVWDGSSSTWKDKAGEVQTPSVDDALFVMGGDVGNLQIPVDSPLQFKSFEVLGECSLTQDCDWRALASNGEINGIINLAGYKLTLSATKGTGTIFAPPPRYADENKEYIRIQYVATDGAQYIDTGIVGATGSGFSIKIESDFMATAAQDWHFIAGIEYSGKYQVSIAVSGTRWAIGHANGSFAYTDHNMFSHNTRYSIVGTLLQGTSTLYVNGSKIHDHYKNAGYGCPLNLFAFARNSDGTPTHFSNNIICYSLKVSRGDKQRDFIPVKRASDGVVGLYEKIEGKFYPSQGVRDFIAGPELYTWEDPSELHLDVLNGMEINNSTLSFDGDLKLVKKGAGTFVSSKTQSYAGGTLVAEGTIQPPDGNNTTAYAGNSSYTFGTGDITVAPGAAFDMRGQYAWREIVLAGGSLVNTYADMTKVKWGASGLRRLYADSCLGVTNSIVFSSSPAENYAINLGGYILDTRIEAGKTLFVQFDTRAITNGIFKVSGPGVIDFRNENTPPTLNMENTILDVSCKMIVQRAIDVMDYIARNDSGENSGSADLNVHGTFKPIGQSFYAPTLQNGAKLDMSKWTGTFPLVSGSKAVAVADGATIHIDMGERGIPSKTPIISWETPPTDASFVWAAGVRSKGKLRIKDDGLYCESGLFILIR